MNKQTYRLIYEQTDRYTDRWSDKQTDILTYFMWLHNIQGP